MLQIAPGSPNINVNSLDYRVAESGDTTARAGCPLNILSPHVVIRILKRGFGLSRFIYIYNAVIYFYILSEDVTAVENQVWSSGLKPVISRRFLQTSRRYDTSHHAAR